eukprot:GEMP01023440.1.p1 GENE.GEMP01023440.1~~GEMP01023440.1.p1  ORF type:complete len:224 (-),score=41.07 GEMP01023440.1:116-787(-)
MPWICGLEVDFFIAEDMMYDRVGDVGEVFRKIEETPLACGGDSFVSPKETPSGTMYDRFEEGACRLVCVPLAPSRCLSVRRVRSRVVDKAWSDDALLFSGGDSPPSSPDVWSAANFTVQAEFPPVLFTGPARVDILGSMLDSQEDTRDVAADWTGVLSDCRGDVSGFGIMFYFCWKVLSPDRNKRPAELKGRWPIMPNIVKNGGLFNYQNMTPSGVQGTVLRM